MSASASRFPRPGFTFVTAVAFVLLSGVEIEASESDSRASSPAGDPAAESAGSDAKAQEKSPSRPVYVPPRRGQPRARVGGGVRGPAAKLPTLRAVVPDHVALTSRSQPTLLWHLDGLPPETATLMFVLTDDEAIDPLISVKLERPVERGLQRIDLSNYEVQLEPERQYQWSVALVTDFQRRSRDVVTIGWIERVATYSGEVVPTSGTASRPAEADVAALAAAGLWYDAVEAANEAEQAALFDQVGLALADGL